jgi:Flp pilus assembly pilin Flp
MNQPSKQSGQTAMEYVVVCAALAMALGVGMSDEGSVLLQLLQAFRTAYQKISYALSIAL